ncbi:class I SAM-dependent methyltransferase [Streptosporangium sp. NPDC000396]|uniref:class I SAM-dependent methyltransferase n=1 Tax=Streptosporangium sp. NPDC000396 TaxID=3366185 RepID=UPI003686ACD7
MENAQRKQTQAPQMEGAMARWYARQRGSAPQLAAFRQYAARLAGDLPPGAAVLEVAPGPGYLVEMARLGLTVTGLDISHTLLEIAAENARRAGVRVDFQQGDAADLPFDGESFDLVVCQAAFKNFGRPGSALNQMHRVLRGGGTAVIHDMNKDISRADIDREVKGMELSPLNAFMTKLPLMWLRRRAYSRAQFEHLAAESAFRTCDVRADGITLEVRLAKRGAD